jgi:heme ABC exporter ATP-binding subunit CcmA
MNAMIKVTHLTVYRDRTPVLNDISFAIRPSEIVAVEGANGAGKTTLLKCLAGAVRPDHGIVTWFGKTARCSPEVRRHIGLAGYECGLYAELTALENLVFAARMHGITNAVECAAESLAAANLSNITDRPVRHLSQGMRQRLAIIRAALHKPQLVLLDEPFSNLDAQGQSWLQQLVLQWRRRGAAVCYVSHDCELNAELANRIISLDAGRIITIRTTGQETEYLRAMA